MDIPVRSFFSEETLDDEASQEKFTLLNLLVNPQDRVGLRCWLGFGSSNGLPGAYSHLRAYCSQRREHPLRVLERLAAGRIHIPQTNRLVQRFNLLRQELGNLRGLAGAEFVEAWLPPDIEELDDLRALTLQVLQNTQDPRRIFEQVRYLITQPELPESPDSVRVMSFHKAKGLTSRLVVLAGCLQGIIPHIDRNLTEEEQQIQLEEQRRLFYVAITRTSEMLIISSPLFLDFHTASRVLALSRRRFGAQVETIFTEFYEECGDEAPIVVDGDEFRAQFTRAAVRRQRH